MGSGNAYKPFGFCQKVDELFVSNATKSKQFWVFILARDVARVRLNELFYRSLVVHLVKVLEENFFIVFHKPEE